jgi:hypothetical protein
LDDFDSPVAESSSTIRVMDSAAQKKKATKSNEVDDIVHRNSDGSFDEHVEYPLQMLPVVLQDKVGGFEIEYIKVLELTRICIFIEDSMQQDEMIDYGNKELAYKMPNLLAAVQQALRTKVMALQNDNWMFDD